MPDQYIKLLYAVFISGIFILAALSLEKNRRLLMGCACILTVLVWLLLILNIKFLSTGVDILEFIFLFALVSGFIRQLAAKTTVNESVFVDAVAGYLLLGFAYSLVATAIINFYPGAYRNIGADSNAQGLYEKFERSSYYAFMTFSTADYGDVTPVTPVAKSLAILISISGQLYVATIISLLISKYMSSGSKQ